MGLRLLGHQAEGEEKGREERAFGPKDGGGVLFLNFLFSFLLFQNQFKNNLKVIFLNQFDLSLT